MIIFDRTTLKIIFIVFFLLLISYVSNNFYKKQIEKKLTQKFLRFPIRLKIPKINVDAAIESIGITSNGEMGVPTNTVNVAWFNLGPRPGEIGSAVIAGHVDKKGGGKGIFTNLSKLKKGDKLHIIDDKGATTTFIIRDKHMYNPGYADDVFTKNDKAHLNLVTCDGVWDKSKKSYTKRLVVFADLTLK